MTADPLVVVHPDPRVLAAAVAARLVTALSDAQAERGTACVALTGGGPGIAALAAVRESPARKAVDWRNLDVWWSDERFLPLGHPERNQTQAGAALLDHVPLDPRRVHPMPASGGEFGENLDMAAAAYSAELTADPSGEPPRFDVLLLGMGEEGHIASIFPGSPAAHAAGAAVVAVRGCPKPPPERISFTFEMIQAAREVWLVTAGIAKAGALAAVIAGADPLQMPAAGARGSLRSLILVDQAAGAGLHQTRTA